MPELSTSTGPVRNHANVSIVNDNDKRRRPSNVGMNENPLNEAAVGSQKKPYAEGPVTVGVPNMLYRRLLVKSYLPVDLRPRRIAIVIRVTKPLRAEPGA
ncbi:hypothetical protein [Pararhizobium arenae]|uniref:hypothetical protein n=1 Tax=Pararhizobium arenae TaxID=1856850 RepID=UPI000A65D69B|nr:hypothetical protein [Pararhizobium arenae]